jgi:hypothetical protein
MKSISNIQVSNSNTRVSRTNKILVVSLGKSAIKKLINLKLEAITQQVDNSFQG